MRPWPILAALAALLAPVAATAADGPAILLAVADTHHPVLPLLRAELAAAGFLVLTMESATASFGERESEARLRGAVATIALAPAPTHIEVAVVDRLTGKAAFREIVTSHREQPAWAEAVAVRIVELLRATLMEITLPQRSRAAPPPQQVQELVAAGMGQHVAVSAAPGLELTPGGLSPSAHLRIGAAHLVRPGLRLGVDGSLPLGRTSVAADEGQADVSVLRGGISGELGPSTPFHGITPSAGLGLQAGVLTMSGRAPISPYVAVTSRVPFAAAELRGSVRIDLHRNLAIAAVLWCGMSVPRIAIQFQDRTVATWGRPFLGAALALQWIVF